MILPLLMYFYDMSTPFVVISKRFPTKLEESIIINCSFGDFDVNCYIFNPNLILCLYLTRQFLVVMGGYMCSKMIPSCKLFLAAYRTHKTKRFSVYKLKYKMYHTKYIIKTIRNLGKIILAHESFK